MPHRSSPKSRRRNDLDRGRRVSFIGPPGLRVLASGREEIRRGCPTSHAYMVADLYPRELRRELSRVQGRRFRSGPLMPVLPGTAQDSRQMEVMASKNNDCMVCFDVSQMVSKGREMFPPCTLYPGKNTARPTGIYITNVTFAEQVMDPFYQGANALLTQTQARRQVSRPEGVHHRASEGA